MPIGQVLFSFDGRIRRSTYWIASILSGIGFTVFLFVFIAIAGLGSASTGEVNAATGASLLTGLVLLIAVPVVIWISLALQVKRWHDRDKTWSWIFISFIPIIGWIWALIEVGFSDGTPGPNRFGPSPKGLGGPAVEGASPVV